MIVISLQSSHCNNSTQDAMEQRKKQFCLIIYGTMVQRNNDFSEVASSMKKIYCAYNLRYIFETNFLISNQEKMRDLSEKLFNTRCGVMVEKVNYQTLDGQTKTLSFQEDIAHVELKSVSGGDTVFTKSIFVRFNDLDLR